MHERDDVVSPLGDVYTAAAHLEGLTPFGADVVKGCNRLGIVVDLAHGTSDMVTGALKVTTQPLIVSHTGMNNDAVKKNISVDMRRRVISSEQARCRGRGRRCRYMVASVRLHKGICRGDQGQVDALGIDHLGIGTDTDLTASNVLLYTNKIWPDQNGGFSMRSPTRC